MDRITELLKLSKEDYYVTLYGSIVENWEALTENDPFVVSQRLRGGKGGFGSLLRSFRIYRSTNQEMCRDLTGRRLKAADEEKKLKKWIEKKAAREAEKERKKKEKIDKLKAGPAKHDFNDKEYQKTKSEILEKTDDAMDAGLKKAETLTGPSDFSVATQLSDEDEESKPGPSKKRKVPESGESCEIPSKKKKKDAKKLQAKGLWGTEIAGILEDADLLSSSDEEGSVDSSTSDKASESSGSQHENEAENTVSIKQNNTTVAKSLIMTPRSVPKKHADGSVSSTSFQYQPSEDTSKTVDEKPSDPVKPTEKKSKKKASPHPPIDPASFNDIDLATVSTQEGLHDFGMDHLKAELQKRGLKCGGALAERAKRLWIVKDLKPEDYPKKLRAQN